MTLNFEYDKLIEELKKAKPKRVLVQLPEGVKKHALEVQEIIEKLGIEVVFSGETAWGGCCVNIHEAEDIGADLIIHFGHAKFIDVNFPILYIEIKDELDLMPLLKKSLDKIKDFKTLGLSYSVQHRGDIPDVIKFYENSGKKIILSDKLGYAAYSGHVVGCEFGGLKTISDKVDAFLIIGNNFHSMGAALAVEKPVILLDVYNNDVVGMEGVRDRILRERAISIQKLKDATKVGIIVEAKPGQKFGNPKYLLDKLREKGKKPILITMNEMTPDKIMNFYDIEAFIELACPRIAVDDFAKYERPILTFKEALVALGEKTWEEMLKIGFI